MKKSEQISYFTFVANIQGNTTINEYEESLKEPERKLKKFEERVNKCPTLPWGHIHCKNRDCDYQLSQKPIKLNCLSNYCSCPECIETRNRIISLRLKDIPIRSKKIYHFTIGFPYINIKDMTKKDLSKIRLILNKFLKLLEKNYKNKIYALSVLDFNRDKKGERIDMLRPHFHIATLPINPPQFVNSIRESIKELRIKGTQIQYNLIGYKNKQSVLNYFSKRVIGEFGHNRGDEQKFTYSTFFNIKQYYEIFYRSKKIKLWRLTAIPREAGEFISMLNNIPKECPCCHNLTRGNTYFKQIEAEINKSPPPNVEKLPICLINLAKGLKRSVQYEYS